MQKISINKYIRKNGLNYEVHVNHNTYQFKNRRGAADFIRGVDNYLNTQFELLNNNLISVYSTYRRVSFYLDSYDLQAIRLQINEVEQAIEITLSRCSWDNFTSFAFDKLGVSIDTLIGILKRMEQISKAKKYTIIAAEIRAELSACELQIIAARQFNFENRKYKANRGEVIQMDKKIIQFNK